MNTLDNNGGLHKGKLKLHPFFIPSATFLLCFLLPPKDPKKREPHSTISSTLFFTFFYSLFLTLFFFFFRPCNCPPLENQDEGSKSPLYPAFSSSPLKNVEPAPFHNRLSSPFIASFSPRLVKTLPRPHQHHDNEEICMSFTWGD